MNVKEVSYMKRLWTFIVAFLLLMSGCAYTEDAVMKEQTEDYAVTATFDQQPPKVGDNTLHITINDLTGKAITDAIVGIDYYMYAEKTGRVVRMPAHGAKAKGEFNGFTGYHATLNFSMTGYWQVEIKIVRDGKEQTAKFFALVK